ncbi:MAG: threonine synthase [Conexivisphaerales archaeon]
MSLQSKWYFKCIACEWEEEISAGDPPGFRCKKCNDLLQLVLKDAYPSRKELFENGNAISVWKYERALPARKKVSLGEGGTPLIKSLNLSRELELENLYVKFEGLNPTGSFKDRGMTVAVARAIDTGARVLVCASTGNTSASLAAYSARAAMKAVVIVPEGKVAKGKLIQAVVYGARIVKVEGSFDAALDMVTRVVVKERKYYLMNSINPFRIEGQKTIAYEVFEQLGRVPDYVVLPVGNAGNISAVWKGFKELKEWGITDKLPAMIGVQAEGAAPIAEALQKGFDQPRVWKEPETAASAIRIGNPVSWKKAMRAIKESDGFAVTVSDSEILESRSKLASREGIFVEAASASPVAALRKLTERIGQDADVVCIATGNGLKDQELVVWSPENVETVTNAEMLADILSD